MLAGWRVYYSPTFFWWWFIFDAYAPDIFQTGSYIAASGGIVAVIVAIAMAVWRAREEKRATTYGSARWADARDMRHAGLIDNDGVVLGQMAERRYLRHDGPEHVLCFAPTRSGKGVGLVVPTLLTWPGSAIVHDIKGENWQLTAGWRARFGRVVLFDPTNMASHAHNCHVRVSFATNDERTAKRVSDALGTATEIRDAKNYAGHRLSPWLCRGTAAFGWLRKLSILARLLAIYLGRSYPMKQSQKMMQKMQLPFWAHNIGLPTFGYTP